MCSSIPVNVQFNFPPLFPQEYHSVFLSSCLELLNPRLMVGRSRYHGHHVLKVGLRKKLWQRLAPLRLGYLAWSRRELSAWLGHVGLRVSLPQYSYVAGAICAIPLCLARHVRDSSTTVAPKSSVFLSSLFAPQTFALPCPALAPA